MRTREELDAARRDYMADHPGWTMTELYELGLINGETWADRRLASMTDEERAGVRASALATLDYWNTPEGRAERDAFYEKHIKPFVAPLSTGDP